MASIYRDNQRDGWRVQVYVNGRRRKLWLGPISEAKARGVAGHLDDLKRSAELGLVQSPDTKRWVKRVGPRVREQLGAWGLIEATAQGIPNEVGPFSQWYLDQNKQWAERTLLRMKNVRKHLLTQIPPSTMLTAVTRGDANRFARWARDKFSSQTHSGKVISDVRQIFKAAIDERLIDENPFAHVDASKPHDRSRDDYVSVATADKVISEIPTYYGAVFAFCRYAGFRCASEHLSLEWSQVDFERNRITVYAPKTKTTRTIPMFPELVQHVRNLEDLANEGAVYVFAQSRTALHRLATNHIKAACTRLGIEVWPKLFNTLRASRQTDLKEQFPIHVVNAWLGHTKEVSEKHYDRVHQDHFDEACGVVRGVARGVEGLDSTGQHETEKQKNP